MIPGSFGRSFARVFIFEVVTGFARVCVPFLMGRAIGAAGYGMYAACTNITVLLFSLASSGLPLAATYYVATHPGKSTPRRLLTFSAASAMAAAALATPLMFYYRELALKEVSWAMVFLATAAGVPYAIEFTALGILRGQGRFEGAAALGLLRQGAMAVIAVSIGLLSGGAEQAVLAFVACGVLLALLTSARAMFTAPNPQGRSAPGFVEIGRYAAQVQTSTFLTFLNYRLTFFLVAALVPGANVGVYAAALTMSEGVWIFSHVVSGFLVGEVAGKASREEGRDLTARACRIVTGASVLVALLAAAGSKLIMGLFGQDFVSGWSSLVVLLFAATALAPSRILASHEAAIGSPGSNIRGTIVGLIVNLVTTGLLVPVLGLVGASIANLLSYCVVAASRIETFRWATADGRAHRLKDLLVPTRDDFRVLVAALPIKCWSRSAVAKDEG